VKASVAGSEIARDSRSRITLIACGSQHTVVSTAPMVPMASTMVAGMNDRYHPFTIRI
jgi:hypothetical protein